jgi:hypothetical protein
MSATRGDAVALDYYFWHDDGRLETRTANFMPGYLGIPAEKLLWL